MNRVLTRRPGGDEQLNLRLEPALKEALNTVAGEQDLNVSQVLRSCARDHVTEHYQPGDATVTITLGTGLHADFIAAADNDCRSPTEILRELVDGYVLTHITANADTQAIAA